MKSLAVFYLVHNACQIFVRFTSKGLSCRAAYESIARGEFVVTTLVGRRAIIALPGIIIHPLLCLMS